MSDPAISAAFFDPEGGVHAVLRAGVGVLFRGEGPEVLDEPPTLARAGAGWTAELAGAAELEFEPLSEEAGLGGAVVRVCRVRGRVGPRSVDCLGTVAETSSPPAWGELDATRSISAVLDAEHALLVFARRPRGARGHGEEELTGWLLQDGALRPIDDARVSTVYDGEGRQRSSSVELWLPGEDLPRRAVGEARAGVTFGLEGLRVHVAVFGWTMEGREGLGAYEVTVRDEDGAVA